MKFKENRLRCGEETDKSNEFYLGKAVLQISYNSKCRKIDWRIAEMRNQITVYTLTRIFVRNFRVKTGFGRWVVLVLTAL